MGGAIRDHYEAFPDPSPAIVPVGQGGLDYIDDALHFAWSWHRHKFVYRKGEGIRILDAGCGTGLSSLGLARLNPGAKVVGVDLSPKSLELAEARAKAAGIATATFREHDLESPLPADLGTFDFVVARNLLGNGDDPVKILDHLVRVLDPRGLLLATFPSAAGRMPVRQLRRAIDAFVGPDASTAERAEIGLELLTALRPDHPIRRFDASRHGVDIPSVEQFVATYLNDRSQDWTLEAALKVIDQAGLKCLFVADRGGWRPDRVFVAQISDRLRERVGTLDELALIRLKDALDISLHPDSYFIYACHASFEPHLPAWPEDADPASYDRLVPQATGLTQSANLNPDPASSRGRVTYRAVNGALGELDFRSDQSLRLVDGVRTIREIEERLLQGPFDNDGADARRVRWYDLAKLGLVLLEDTDPRQNVDCVHLGSVKDRLDCACPRRWIRGCELHTLCTISTIGDNDPKAAVLHEALGRFGVDSVTACDRCSDYSPED
jgi:SAM-dependent methyltransferase